MYRVYDTEGNCYRDDVVVMQDGSLRVVYREAILDRDNDFDCEVDALGLNIDNSDGRYVVEMCSYRTDKCGDPVYEGDRIELQEGIATVSFDEDTFYARYDDTGKTPTVDWWPLSLAENRDMKVVGTIHDKEGE